MEATKKNWLPFELFLVIFSLIIHAYIVFAPEASMLNWYSNDDAFYYFKVAQNIASGHGVTFDGINITNGFHPLWMLMCIPVFSLARSNPMMPLRVIIIIAGFFNIGTSVLLFRLLKRKFLPVTSALIAVIWISSWSIYSSLVQNGLESNISAFLITTLLILVVAEKGRRISIWKQVFIGLIGGLTVLARLDNIFLVMMVGAWFTLDRFTTYLRSVIVWDIGIIFCVSLLSFFIRLGTGPQYIENSSSLPWLIGLHFILVPISLFLFDLYKLNGEAITLKYIFRTIIAVSLPVFIGGLLLLLFQKFAIFDSLPRSILIIDGLLLLICIFFSRVIFRLVWVRKESSFVIEVLTHDLIKNQWRHIALRVVSYFSPLAILLGIYMLWSQLVVGVPIPVSGQVKHWWGIWPNTVYGKPVQAGSALFGFDAGGAWTLLIGILEKISSIINFGSESTSWVVFIIYVVLGVGIIGLIINKWQMILVIVDYYGFSALFCGIYAHILNYTATSYIHMRPWYWSAEILFSVILLALLFDCTWRSIILEKNQRIGITILVLIGILLIGTFIQRIFNEFPYKMGDRAHVYISEVQYLESKTEPGSFIGMPGGGTVGYFIKGRTIINLDGLINSPGYFNSLRNGQGDIFLYFQGLDYVYGSQYMLTASDPYWQLLEGHLAIIDNNNDDYALYKYYLSGK